MSWTTVGSKRNTDDAELDTTAVEKRPRLVDLNPELVAPDATTPEKCQRLEYGKKVLATAALEKRQRLVEFTNENIRNDAQWILHEDFHGGSLDDVLEPEACWDSISRAMRIVLFVPKKPEEGTSEEVTEKYRQMFMTEKNQFFMKVLTFTKQYLEQVLVR
jgi:hypothetical protein